MSEVNVTISANGSIRVEGEFRLLDGDGNALPLDEPGRAWLCRCGGSANKPYCDGTHRRNGFRGDAAPRAPR